MAQLDSASTIDSPVITPTNASCDANVHPYPPPIVFCVACVRACLYYVQVSARFVQRFLTLQSLNRQFQSSQLLHAPSVASPKCFLLYTGRSHISQVDISCCGYG